MANPIRIGINGFGRIGRKIARLALTRNDVEIVGINDLSDMKTRAHLLKYDSAHGIFPLDVKVDGDFLIVSGGGVTKKIKCTSEKDPTALPWGSLGVQFAHECTGIFTSQEKASLHLKAGAKKVVISAPAKDKETPTFCMGVNEKAYDGAKDHVVSNASCTTNCLAPLVKVLDDTFGVNRGMMTTVHSYTNDQNILDLPHSDPRRARAAAVSQIPTTTGAAKAIGLVLPHLKGKLDGFSVRVPTPNVSLVDLTVELKKTTTKEEIQTAFKNAANGPLKGILGYTTEPLVSIDYNGNLASSTVDGDLTNVIDGNLAKVVSWYDNESGFSARMIDLTLWMARQGL
ncbi:MAG: type I glyceraldehyde-3-phosphate dehydrogenase [Bacteriovoracia bacterium]